GWVRRSDGEGKRVSFQPALDGPHLAVPGEEHEQPVVWAHLRDPAIDGSLDTRLGGSGIFQQRDVVLGKAEAWQRPRDRARVGDGEVQARHQWRTVLVDPDDHRPGRSIIRTEVTDGER